MSPHTVGLNYESQAALPAGLVFRSPKCTLVRYLACHVGMDVSAKQQAAPFLQVFERS